MVSGAARHWLDAQEAVIGIARGAGSRDGGKQRSAGNPLTADARRDYFFVFLGKTADVGVPQDHDSLIPLGVTNSGLLVVPTFC